MGVTARGVGTLHLEQVAKNKERSGQDPKRESGATEVGSKIRVRSGQDPGGSQLKGGGLQGPVERNGAQWGCWRRWTGGRRPAAQVRRGPYSWGPPGSGTESQRGSLTAGWRGG
ncbi:hypothetical protein NDU88_004947 [Pleurodeles waltl]|uniref:Uncharacterized protein n=1 Tax=Pleurodeles waltl TaxID=8319 RepID=A0AAV7TTE0_PLEWA|nr:hypothetical protein NDU88_004947 [Pleurodeles waltl]